MTGWFGFFAPKGTPRTAIGKLNAAMVKVPADPRARTRFAELGLDVAPAPWRALRDWQPFARWKSKHGGRSSRLRGFNRTSCHRMALTTAEQSTFFQRG